MIPILYKSAEVDFTTNGLGLLNDIYSVDIQEQRNGLLTLTASYPTNAKHYKEIETGRIIYAKPNPLDGAQAFRIVKTELDISGYNLNIEADHITYDLTHNLVKEVHLQGDGQNAMTHLQNATVTPHLFRFVSDLQHLGDSRLQYVNPMEAIAGTEGSILQIWGGELHRDNRTVSMLSRRGRDNFTTFRLGKNINGLKYTVDMSNVTTRIVPTVTKSDATDNDKAYFVVGDTVDSKNLNKYPNVYIQHVDMGEKVTINEGETDEQIKAKIDKQAKNWFTQSANTGIDLPQVTVEIDVTSLQDSADYQEKFRNLESVGLTDTVSVYVPEFNVNVTAIVNELHYDPVAERVTSLVVGTSKKSFADNNSNALAELQNSITQIRQDATTAIVSSNGKNTNYYGTEEPAHPVEGDLWFKQVGDETYLMIFKDGRWQEWVSTKTQEEIAKKVDDAVKKAKEYTDELNEKQAEEVQKFQSEANAALSSAAAERNSLASQADTMLDGANSYATSMADSAAAYGKAQASNVLSQAQTELSTAKQQLGSEVSKAQADITATNKQLAGKVSQTDFDKTTGDLSTKYGQVKATADAVKTDVAKYKETNDKNVSANKASIATMSDQIDSKVSQTDFDKTTGDLNGKFTQQKQTVDSISQTVTELQAKANAQGQINQLMNTEFSPDLQGWEDASDASSPKPYLTGVDGTVNSRLIGFKTGNTVNNTYARFLQWVPTGSDSPKISLSWESFASSDTTGKANIYLGFADSNGKMISSTQHSWINPGKGWGTHKWENISLPSGTRKIKVSFEAVGGVRAAYFGHPMLIFGETIGDYAPGNYNNNARVSALEVDLKGITGLVNDPKKGLSATATLAANGLSVATKAQGDATTAIQTANGIQNTVESFQKDVKDLQSTTTQTAGQVTTEIEDRKNGDKSVRTDMANLIDQRVKSVERGYESAISQSADKIMASVSQPNQLLNTEFSPDTENWEDGSDASSPKPYLTGIDANTNSRLIGFKTGNTVNNIRARFLQWVPTDSDAPKISLSWESYASSGLDNNNAILWLGFYDDNKLISAASKPWIDSGKGWGTRKWENISLPTGTKRIKVSFEAVGGITAAYLGHPMLVFGSTVGTYTAGSYSGMNTSTVLELFKDNWALGIADNAGRIISGINGDTSGTVIQGKKLVINSDTTINGKAFIDGSVIKNASIGTAQIGKAAVGSAQIINVDVSKISGNIANFITANINTLNAKVLYGDTGHLGTTDTGRVINKQDNHLQLASKGMYNSANDRAQVELLSHTNDIDANMQGSFNYYSDVRKGHGLGIRLVQNQILAIDEDGGSKMLYLSPYQGGEVRVVSRDKQAYYPMRASSFNAMSSRSAKSDIVPFEDCALNIVKNTKIRTYVKSGKQEIGVISDEADPRMLTDDDNAVSLYDYTSILYKAVQELSEQVKELQNERPNN